MKITSAALLWLGWLSGADAQPAPAQDNTIVTPRFVPAPKRVPSDAVPVHFAEPSAPAAKTAPAAAQGLDKTKARSDAAIDEMYLPPDLPGPQIQFRRESEAAFYMRIAQTAPKQLGQAAIFPVETPVSKEAYQPRVFPPQMAQVEPLFVLHQRLLFEQPNFERGLWDFGIVQPVISLGVFYYDMALLPYHFYSDLRDRSEGNLGKCLPGDQTPLRVPIERFSVTGAIGEVGVIIAGGYLFP